MWAFHLLVESLTGVGPPSREPPRGLPGNDPQSNGADCQDFISALQSPEFDGPEAEAWIVGEARWKTGEDGRRRGKTLQQHGRLELDGLLASRSCWFLGWIRMCLQLMHCV